MADCCKMDRSGSSKTKPENDQGGIPRDGAAGMYWYRSFTILLVCGGTEKSGSLSLFSQDVTLESDQTMEKCVKLKE